MEVNVKSPMRFLATRCLLVAALWPALTFSQTLSDKQKLGKAIFFDQNLSVNRNQACAACHAPESGWTGPDAGTNLHGAVYEGSVAGRFGNRKPPSSAYATQSPVLNLSKKGLFLGGNFWDGRATGQKLGNPAADQAQGPFLNPAEQALPVAACVVYRVCTASYAVPFTSVWGPTACSINWPADTKSQCAAGGTIALSPADQVKSNEAYDAVALSIAAYEASPEVNAFSSKYDLSFKGADHLTAEERKGFALFMGKAKCSRCHPAAGPGALLTDFSYDNLGVPKNPDNPFYSTQESFIDEGLGAFLRSLGYSPSVYGPELGKMKVPTLRNVDRRPYPGFPKAFAHNGYFKSLEEIVHFYNTRDVYPVCSTGLTEKVNCWPAPEYAGNVNRSELGNLGLSSDEETALVIFLKTLSDGYQP
jgi:cytochrome c peroxidase